MAKLQEKWFYRANTTKQARVQLLLSHYTLGNLINSLPAPARTRWPIMRRVMFAVGEVKNHASVSLVVFFQKRKLKTP